MMYGKQIDRPGVNKDVTVVDENAMKMDCENAKLSQIVRYQLEHSRPSWIFFSK